MRLHKYSRSSYYVVLAKLKYRSIAIGKIEKYYTTQYRCSAQLHVLRLSFQLFESVVGIVALKRQSRQK